MNIHQRSFELPYDAAEVYDLLEELISVLRSDTEAECKDALLESVQELNYVGERIMAYEDICDAIDWHKIPITERAYQLIEQTGRATTLFKPDYWERLRPLVR